MKHVTLLLTIMLIFSMFNAVVADAAAPEGISHARMMPVDNIANHGSTMVELPDGTLFRYGLTEMEKEMGI